MANMKSQKVFKLVRKSLQKLFNLDMLILLYKRIFSPCLQTETQKLCKVCKSSDASCFSQIFLKIWPLFQLQDPPEAEGGWHLFSTWSGDHWDQAEAGPADRDGRHGAERGKNPTVIQLTSLQDNNQRTNCLSDHIYCIDLLLCITEFLTRLIWCSETASWSD